MLKKNSILLNLVIVSALFFVFLNPVKAQTATPTLTTSQAKPNLTWRCLKPLQIGDSGQHRVHLINDPDKHVIFPAPGVYQDGIYIVGCAMLNNYKCTTGNSTFDDSNHLGLNPDSRYTFSVDGGARQTAINGQIDAIATSATPNDTVDHRFWGVTVGEKPETITGFATTLQQGTIPGADLQEKCISIHWDPFGRFFDSQSLEPIPNVQVKLLDQNKQLVNQIGVTNPYPATAPDGAYFFMVTPGTYFLEPVLPSSYIFSVKPNLNPGYTKAYSNIYVPNEPIVEKAGVPEHRDIALDPGTNPPFHSDPVSMNYGVLKLGNATQIEGRVSHPLTIVVVSQNSKEIARKTSDKNGNYSILVSDTSLKAIYKIAVDFIKVDLTGANKIYPKTTGYVFSPILPYIDGDASVNNSLPMPYATVDVKLDSSGNTYSQTTTDAKGHFSIPPQSLPIFSYRLEYKAKNSSVPIVLTTDEFANANKNYLDQNKINLMTMTKNGVVLFKANSVEPTNPNQGFATNQIGNQANAKQNSTTNPEGTSSSANNIYLIFAIVLLLIGGAGTLIGFYIYKKNRVPPTL